jgi:hypothetical protein
VIPSELHPILRDSEASSREFEVIPTDPPAETICDHQSSIINHQLVGQLLGFRACQKISDTRKSADAGPTLRSNDFPKKPMRVHAGPMRVHAGFIRVHPGLKRVEASPIRVQAGPTKIHPFHRSSIHIRARSAPKRAPFAS